MRGPAPVANASCILDDGVVEALLFLVRDSLKAADCGENQEIKSRTNRRFLTCFTTTISSNLDLRQDQSRMSASPAPEQSGQSTPAITSKSQSQTPAPSNPPAPAGESTPKPPSPLDGLSPADLRKKLEENRNLLRTQLEKKRKLDRDLVSPPSLSLSVPSIAKDAHSR